MAYLDTGEYSWPDRSCLKLIEFAHQNARLEMPADLKRYMALNEKDAINRALMWHRTLADAYRALLYPQFDKKPVECIGKHSMHIFWGEIRMGLGMMERENRTERNPIIGYTGIDGETVCYTTGGLKRCYSETGESWMPRW